MRGGPPVAAVRGVAAALVAGGAALAYGGLVERNAFTLRRFDVPVLPPGGRPLRLLHLSDIHMIGRQRRKQAWLADLARLTPDLVAVTGDNLSAPDGVAALLAALGPLAGTPGVFVLGSNDYYAPLPKNPAKYLDPQHERVHGPELPWTDLIAGFAAAGWQDLTNRRTTLRVAGRLLDLRGVDDPHLARDRPEQVAGPPRADADLALGLVHAPEPRVLDRYVADGVQLVLCGHTHGGQLRVPRLGAVVTNCGIDRARCRWLSRYAAGTREGWLHVSAGLGTSPYAPVRFASPPEATLLTLHPR